MFVLLTLQYLRLPENRWPRAREWHRAMPLLAKSERHTRAMPGLAAPASAQTAARKQHPTGSTGTCTRRDEFAQRGLTLSEASWHLEMRSGDKDTKAFCAAACSRKSPRSSIAVQAQPLPKGCMSGDNIKLGPTRLADLSLSWDLIKDTLKKLAVTGSELSSSSSTSRSSGSKIVLFLLAGHAL